MANPARSRPPSQPKRNDLKINDLSGDRTDKIRG